MVRNDGPSTQAEEEAMRERARETFVAGRYPDALSQSHSALLSKGIRWFREEGTHFQRPHEKLAPTELILGLAFAAQAVVRERGEEASHKLQTAASLFSAIAELRLALEGPSPDHVRSMTDKLAEIVIRSAMVGQVEMIMTTIDLGWFEKLAQHEMDREKRRLGASLVNAKKEGAKQSALNEAIRLSGRNPTLSNEELARKVLDAAMLQTTIRTVTDWVREWLRKEYIPAQKAT